MAGFSRSGGLGIYEGEYREENKNSKEAEVEQAYEAIDGEARHSTGEFSKPVCSRTPPRKNGCDSQEHRSAHDGEQQGGHGDHEQEHRIHLDLSKVRRLRWRGSIPILD